MEWCERLCFLLSPKGQALLTQLHKDFGADLGPYMLGYFIDMARAGIL
jgi:hypothetical protein